MPAKRTAEMHYVESRGLWRKRIKDPNTGKWVDVYGKTKAEVRTRTAEKQASFAAAQQRQDVPFFHQYAARWYELNAPGKSAKMQQNYRTAINKHLCPVLGMLLIKDITSDDCMAVRAAIAPLAHETQLRVLSVLRRILRSAVKAHIIPENPAEDVKAGGARTEEKVPLSRDQQQALMSCLNGHRCKTFAALALYAGLRREEAAALQWDCVFLDAPVPYLSVRRACRWEGNKAAVSEELKSGAARRDIPIPPPLLSILREAKQHATGSAVVPAEDGEVMSLGSLRRMWKIVPQSTERTVHYKVNGREYVRELKVGDVAPYTGIRIALDFPVHPHQLRHTYITELVLSGADVKTVQYLAGHSDVRVTLQIYTHILNSQPERTARAVLAAFPE